MEKDGNKKGILANLGVRPIQSGYHCYMFLMEPCQYRQHLYDQLNNSYKVNNIQHDEDSLDKLKRAIKDYLTYFAQLKNALFFHNQPPRNSGDNKTKMKSPPPFKDGQGDYELISTKEADADEEFEIILHDANNFDGIVVDRLARLKTFDKILEVYKLPEFCVELLHEEWPLIYGWCGTMIYWIDRIYPKTSVQKGELDIMKTIQDYFCDYKILKSTGMVSKYRKYNKSLNKALPNPPMKDGIQETIQSFVETLFRVLRDNMGSSEFICFDKTKIVESYNANNVAMPYLNLMELSQGLCEFKEYISSVLSNATITVDRERTTFQRYLSITENVCRILQNLCALKWNMVIVSTTIRNSTETIKTLSYNRK